MKKTLPSAVTATLPVMAGYLILGFGFGIIMKSNGFSTVLAAAMSIFIYAGSMQYVAIGLMTGGASLVTTALTTLTVNIRHLFYGISMLDKYQHTGKAKPYLIFALTDETYSLVCGELPHIPPENRTQYQFLVSLLNHLYWITGSMIGSLLARQLPFDLTGIDYSMTALFIVICVERMMNAKDRLPLAIGGVCSVACLLLLGPDAFLAPALAVTALLLVVLCRKEAKA